MISFKNGAAQVPAYIVTDTSMAIMGWRGILDSEPVPTSYLWGVLRRHSISAFHSDFGSFLIRMLNFVRFIEQDVIVSLVIFFIYIKGFAIFRIFWWKLLMKGTSLHVDKQYVIKNKLVESCNTAKFTHRAHINKQWNLLKGWTSLFKHVTEDSPSF